MFTGGCTEANNMVIKGVAEQHCARGKHTITTAVEHPAVLEPCKWLARKHGFKVTVLPVNDLGRINVRDLERAMRRETILVSVMLANNEVGTLNRIADIAQIVHAYGALLHTDAAQAIGKMDVNVAALGVDFLSIAGHKFYAPKGIGALYVRSGVMMQTYLHGAPQEGNRRAGTENVPYIVALGQAAQVAMRDMPLYLEHLENLRDRLADGLCSQVADMRVNGDLVEGLPNTLSVSFRGIEANKLLAAISDRVAASAGAACHSETITVSPVLEAMRIPLEYAMGTLRLSVGKMTAEEEVDQTVEIIAQAVQEMRVSEHTQ